MMILIVVVIAAAMYYMMKGDLSFTQKRGDAPVTVLKERYVKGEIDEATYLQMKETLKNS